MLHNSLLFLEYKNAKVPTNNSRETQHSVTAIKTLTVKPALII
jgi:hypothetical protein